MRARQSLVMRPTWGVMLGLCICLSPIEMAAQAGAASDALSALTGSWTLNRELTGPTPSPDVPSTRAGRRGGGPGGGFGGGFGGGRGGGGQTAQTPADTRKEGERLGALVQELLTPTTRWLIGREAGETVAFTNADGRTVRYTPNNKTEKHQLTNGTIETRSRWNRGELRQEIAISDGISIVRTLAIDASTRQLIVTTTLAGGSRGGQERPFKVVYDRDEN